MKFAWLALTVFIAVGIFVSSSISGEYSGYASMAVAETFRRVLQIEYDTISAATLNFILRKFSHLVVYFALSFCLANYLKFITESRRNLFLAAWLLASAYGVIDEIHQYFVPGRHSDAWDWVANTLGSMLGAVAIMLIMRKRSQNAGNFGAEC